MASNYAKSNRKVALKHFNLLLNVTLSKMNVRSRSQPQQKPQNIVKHAQEKSLFEPLNSITQLKAKNYGHHSVNIGSTECLNSEKQRASLGQTSAVFNSEK